MSAELMDIIHAKDEMEKAMLEFQKLADDDRDASPEGCMVLDAANTRMIEFQRLMRVAPQHVPPWERAAIKGIIADGQKAVNDFAELVAKRQKIYETFLEVFGKIEDGTTIH